MCDPRCGWPLWACVRAFLERRGSPGPFASIRDVVVFRVPKLWGRDFGLGQRTGGLLPHLARGGAGTARCAYRPAYSVVEALTGLLFGLAAYEFDSGGDLGLIP